MNRKKKLIILGIILAVPTLTAIILLAFIARGSKYNVFSEPWTVVKEWKAKQHLKNAENLIEQNLDEAARGLLQSASILDPKSTDIQRLIAKLIAKESIIQGAAAWQAIIRQENSIPEDHLELIDLALKINQLPLAEKHFQSLSTNLDITKGFRYNFLKGQWLERTKKISEALTLINKALLVAPDESSKKQTQLIKVRLCIRSKNPQLIQEGKELLEQLSQGTSEESMEAIRFYFSISGYTKEEAKAILKKTEFHPLSKRKDLLHAYALYHYTHQDERSSTIQTVEKLFNLENDNDLYEYTKWLGSLREWEKVTELLTFPVSIRTKELFLLRLDALASIGNWKEIEQNCDSRKAPLESYWRKVFRGRAFMQLGEPERAKSQWEQAFGEAEDDKEELIRMARHFEKIRELKGLGILLRKLALDPALEVPALHKLISYEAKTVDLDEMLQWVTLLSLRKPNEKRLSNDLNYFRLLAGKRISEAFNSSKDLFVQKPGTLGFRITHALAQYKTDNIQEALSLLEAPFISWNNARPAWLYVYATILNANGYKDQASEIFGNIEFSSLPICEQQGLKGL